MKNRDFKLSSVLIIQVIMTLIIFLLGKIFNVSSIDETYAEPSLLYSILSMLIYIVTNFIVAYGLLSNKMGSVSDYMKGIRVINPRNFSLSLVVNIIPTIAVLLFGAGISSLITNSILLGKYSQTGTITTSLIIVILLSMIYYVFTAYQYFIIADAANMSFSKLFKKIFVVGKDMAAKTIKLFLKWIVLPIVIYLVLIIALFSSTSQGNVGAIVFASILSIVFVVYILIAYANFLNQLSLNYIDYKNKFDNKLI